MPARENARYSQVWEALWKTMKGAVRLVERRAVLSVRGRRRKALKDYLIMDYKKGCKLPDKICSPLHSKLSAERRNGGNRYKT